MTTPQPCTLAKGERIHLKRSIDELFARGQSFVSYPLRVVYLLGPEPLEARGQIMVSVPKKYFRRAVKRNRLKRLVREAYRQGKHPWLSLLEAHGLYGRIAWMCVAKELPDYATVARAVDKALRRIARDRGLSPSEPISHQPSDSHDSPTA